MIKLKRENIFAIFLLFFICSVSLPQEFNYKKIGIVHSELTKQLLYKNNNLFYPILDWELLFLNNKIAYSVIEDQDLDRNNFNEFDVLILPSVEILSDQAIENLKEFLDTGKNIFVLGKLGSFDAELNTREPDAIEILAGFSTQELTVENRISEKISFLGSNFLTQDLNCECEYLILNNFIPLYAEQIPLKTNPLGRYLLYDTEGRNESFFTGAVAIEDKRGKVLWFGFQLAQVALQEKEINFFNQIILNGINWLRGTPMVWLNRYPEFYRSATIFSFWINKTTISLNESIPIFKEKKFPVDFFIAPAAIKESFEEVYKLSAAGNINLLFDDFKYFNSDTLQIKLIFEQTSQILKAGSRQEYFGVQMLNYPESDFYKLKPETYFDFHLNPELRLSYLKSEKDIKSTFNITPYYVNDYLDLFESDDTLDLEYLNYLYKNLNNTGGIISQIVIESSIPNLSDSFTKYLELILNFSNLSNSYVTTYSDLIHWFKVKNDIEVNISDTADESVMILKVKNKSDTIAENIGLNISIPSEYEKPELIGYDVKFDFNTETGYYNLLIPFLLSEQMLTIEIDYRK